MIEQVDLFDDMIAIEEVKEALNNSYIAGTYSVKSEFMFGLRELMEQQLPLGTKCSILAWLSVHPSFVYIAGGDMSSKIDRERLKSYLWSQDRLDLWNSITQNYDTADTQADTDRSIVVIGFFLIEEDQSLKFDLSWRLIPRANLQGTDPKTLDDMPFATWVEKFI